MLLLLLITASSAINDDVGVVRAGHTQARQAIQSLHVKALATVNYHGKKPRPATRYKLEWWQDGETFRSKEEMDESGEGPGAQSREFTDRLWKGGRSKTLTRPFEGGKPGQAVGSLGERSLLVTATSPWNWGLFEFLPGAGMDMLDALGDKAKHVESVERETVNGRLLFRVKFQRKGQLAISAWFDPSVNFLVRKLEVRNVESETLQTREVTEFRESQPGVFFPYRVVSKGSLRGEPTQDSTVEVESLRVNEPIDPSVFQIAFPKGTAVTDEIQGTAYLSANDEEPDLTVQVRSLPPKSTGRTQYATGQAPEEPFSWTRAALWFAVAVGAACLCLWVIRYLRRRAL
jgi:hypothetical protein